MQQTLTIAFRDRGDALGGRIGALVSSSEECSHDRECGDEQRRWCDDVVCSGRGCDSFTYTAQSPCTFHPL
jgi:hypothetical protein